MDIFDSLAALVQLLKVRYDRRFVLILVGLPRHRRPRLETLGHKYVNEPRSSFAAQIPHSPGMQVLVFPLIESRGKKAQSHAHEDLL